MYNLLALVIRFSGTIAFVILELLSFYLVVQFNQRQKEVFVNSSNAVVGAFYERYDKVMSYFYLSKTAEKLSDENAQLYAQLGTAKFNDYVVKDSLIVKDSTQHIKQRYTYIAAKVINNSISKFNNYITLNRGSRHGVRKGMGVISPQNGVVGIIKETSDNFSTVISILHQQTKISTAVKNNNFFGSLTWRNPTNPKLMSLEAIPKQAKLEKKDSIITYGSLIFPEGIYVGEIADFRLPAGSNFYEISVALANDIGSLQYVYIVNDLMLDEQKKLENKVNNE